MRVQLNTDYLLNGQIYEAGIHDLPDGVASQLEAAQKRLTEPHRPAVAGILVKATGGSAPATPPAPPAPVVAAAPVTLSQDRAEREQAVQEQKAAAEREEARQAATQKAQATAPKVEVAKPEASKPAAVGSVGVTLAAAQVGAAKPDTTAASRRRARPTK